MGRALVNVTVSPHRCRGRFPSSAAATGSYDYVAGAGGGELEVLGVCVDRQRAGLDVVVETAQEVWG